MIKISLDIRDDVYHSFSSPDLMTLWLESLAYKTRKGLTSASSELDYTSIDYMIFCLSDSGGAAG